MWSMITIHDVYFLGGEGNSPLKDRQPQCLVQEDVPISAELAAGILPLFFFGAKSEIIHEPIKW